MKNKLVRASCFLALMTGTFGLTANASPKQVVESVMEVKDRAIDDKPEVVRPQKISRDEIKARIDNGKPVILVDALPEQYFRLSHLTKSINIPYERCDELAGSSLPDKNAEIIVYCMDSK